MSSRKSAVAGLTQISEKASSVKRAASSAPGSHSTHNEAADVNNHTVRQLTEASQRPEKARIIDRIIRVIGPERNTKPLNHTVAWSLGAFVGFVILTSIAARVSTDAVRVAYSSIACVLFVVLFGLTGGDLLLNKDLFGGHPEGIVAKQYLQHRTYQRNLGNTCISVLILIPATTALYCFVWFPKLNREVLQTTEDTVVRKRELSNTAKLRQAFRRKRDSQRLRFSNAAIGLRRQTW